MKNEETNGVPKKDLREEEKEKNKTEKKKTRRPKIAQNIRTYAFVCRVASRHGFPHLEGKEPTTTTTNFFPSSFPSLLSSPK